MENIAQNEQGFIKSGQYSHFMKTWFQIFAQRYPGGTFLGNDWQGKPRYDFDTQDKFRYLGLTPSDNWSDYNNLGRSQSLRHISPQHIAFAIDHLAQKYYPQLEPLLIHQSYFCQRMSYFAWSDTDEFPGSAEVLEMLWQDANEIGESLAERAEITDPKLSGELSSYIVNNVNMKLESLMLKKLKDETFFVRVYGSSQAYGGAEEGGWWYTDSKLAHEEQVQGLQNACRRRVQLEKKFSALAKDSFYEDLDNNHGGVVDLYDQESSAAGGMGDLSYDAQEGMQFSPGWTTSAFEKYFAQVELSPEPKSETKVRPHYE